MYVILTPYKGNIIYPSTQKILVKDEYEHNIDKEIKKLNKNNNMHIINPINEIKEASKNNLMYFKTEHHWTDDGAFIGYQELMKEITKKHPDIKVLKEQDFNFSYNTKIRSEWDREYTWGRNTIITNMPLNYKKKLHQTKYRYYTYKDYKLLETKLVNVPYRKTKDFYFPKGADYRVIVLGTSMSENLTEFIQYTFKHVHRIRINGVKKIPTKEEYKILKYYEKEIMDYHPNIIVLCISYNNILHLRNIF